MKVGVGLSREKDPEAALQEAYRKSLQKLKATKADFVLISYSYDYVLDPALFSAVLKKVFKYIPHVGSSTWGAWTQKESFEGETGLVVLSFKDLEAPPEFFKVHSLREKAELWSAEMARQLGDKTLAGGPFDSVFFMADSLNFVSGSGFSFLERHFPNTQFFGLGTSYSVPQCSVLMDGEVYMNALVGVAFRKCQPWVGLLQSVKPELNAVSINRMSENLIIEMDGKPAFYKLCEHLMTQDDMPMMSPDEFRKHMGNLFIVERQRGDSPRLRSFGEPYRVISLLGSEMTTGMVAVANPLDFAFTHYLAQKKTSYALDEAHPILKELKEKMPKPSLVMMLQSSSRARDKDRDVGDFQLITEYFPDAQMLGITSNGEYLGGLNQYSALVILFP